MGSMSDGPGVLVLADGFVRNMQHLVKEQPTDML